jgi:hypothetical protein
MSTNNKPVCPDGCESNLPENTYNFCKQAIETGEVEEVFLARGDAECFTDWKLPGEWAARISMDSLAPAAIRRFRGIGDFPAGASDAIDISKAQKFYTEKTFTLNFDVEDVSDENYEFMRSMECNNVVKGWFAAGTKLFGGNCGLDVSVGANYVIERGQKTLHKIMLVFTWNDQFSPERTSNPIV